MDASKAGHSAPSQLADSSNLSRPGGVASAASGLSKGILLAMAIGASSLAMRSVPGLTILSPMLLAVVIGMLVSAKFRMPGEVLPGLNFVLRRLLRLAIVLLGLQLTVEQVISTGPVSLAIIAATVAASFIFTVWLGGIMRVDRRLTELIAAGTAICGASAIIATNAVTRARGEDVAYALASVTLFGSVAMFTYPFIAAAIGLDAFAYGLWTGASIHEVAQVVAAAFQGGQQAGELGTTTKLSRVLFLAPLIIVLGLQGAYRREGGDTAGLSAVPVPWFVVGFLALVVANSVFDVPLFLRSGAHALSGFMLTMALAAMGLQTNIARLRDRGMRPLLLGFISTNFIAIFSLTLIFALV